MPISEVSETRLVGIDASPGICIGKAYLVDKKGVDVVERYTVGKKDLKNEISRFKSAVKRAKDELGAIIKNAPEELRQQIYILETHMELLKDKTLNGNTIGIIESEGVNAEWALRKTETRVRSMFQTIEDPYLKERASDITHITDRILRHLVGGETINIADIDRRVILVAQDLSPTDASQINLERVKGFITDRGGRTSHTSIVARTLEIPAVMGLENATGLIQNEDLIIIDGTAGLVITHPTEETLADFEEQRDRYERHQAEIIRESHLKAETVDGFHSQVLGNIELPEEVVAVLAHGGDGVGLYRTEFQYMGRPDFPTEDELFEKYKDVVEVMAPKPVTIRTLDINGDKTIGNATHSEEENPALGLRAIRYCLKNPEVFTAQLRAILRASAFGKVRILFPMISSYEEVVEAKRILAEAAEGLHKEGVPFNQQVKFGVLIEVPSAVIMADVLAGVADFFSIGTNDLIQYSLAIDRGNRHVAHLYNPLNPAVIRMVRHVADAAKDKGIKVFMCGEMAGDPYHVPILLGLGLDGLSMNPQSIPAVKRMVRMISYRDARRFMKDVLEQTSTDTIAEMVRHNFGSLLVNNHRNPFTATETSRPTPTL